MSREGRDRSLEEFVGADDGGPPDDSESDSEETEGSTDHRGAEESTERHDADGDTGGDADGRTTGEETATDDAVEDETAASEAVGDETAASEAVGDETATDGERQAVDPAEAEPATATYRWEPSGVECPHCETVVERLWIATGSEGAVCVDCKEW